MKARSSADHMGMDKLKWLLTAGLVLGGIFANHVYGDIAWSFRLIGWLVLFGAVFALAYQTSQGRAAVAFLQESRVELRKVFWPTRQETLQVTLMVVAVVAVLAVVLWGMDGVLVWLMGWLTGQRG